MIDPDSFDAFIADLAAIEIGDTPVIDDDGRAIVKLVLRGG